MPNKNPFPPKFALPLYMVSTLNPINTSMLATALVPIAKSMNVPVAKTTILVTVLYLASSIAQPTAGKLSEEFGPLRILLGGILIVLIGGLIGGFIMDSAGCACSVKILHFLVRISVLRHSLYVSIP